MMHRWVRLTAFLSKLGKDQIVLGHDQIEQILGHPLPASALKHPAFWSNSEQNSYSTAWRAAGFRVTRRGLPAGHICFEREDGTIRRGGRRLARSKGALSDHKPRINPTPLEADVVLVGCVKEKGDHAAPARELCVSALFRARRSYAERTGKPWFIISAKYGLVDPEAIIEPYDLKITDLSADEVDAWSTGVAEKLVRRVGDLKGRVVEIHTGEDYLLPLVPEIGMHGGRVSWPIHGLRFGKQLEWYRNARRVHEAAARNPQLRLPRASENDRPLSREITGAFCNEDLDLTARPNSPKQGWDAMPEVQFVNKLKEQGFTGADVRLFLTFTSAMERIRGADRLWDAATRLFRETPWMFRPKEVLKRTFDEVAQILRRSGVSKLHRPDSNAWWQIADALSSEELAPKVYRAIFSGEANASELLAAVQAPMSSGRARFPLLRGKKIAPMWVRMLVYPGGAGISGIEAIPVAVDVQVRRVTENLGVTDTRDVSPERARAIIQQAWAGQLRAHGAEGPEVFRNTAAALDPALWFFGKLGCTHCEQRGRKVPISSVCEACRFDAF